MNTAKKVAKEEFLSLNHWTSEDYRQQMTGRELRGAIKQYGDFIIRWGRNCYIRTEPIGGGMYNVWFERKKI